MLKTKMNKTLLVVTAGLAALIIVVWSSTSIQGVDYEVKPEITIPEYRTDAARAIDAYERIMNRYMDVTERNLDRIGADVRGIVRKLDSVDNKLTELSVRMTRIEKALGIEQPKRPVKEVPKPEARDRADNSG
ncbi:MAG: hypothetical protein DRP62_02645 [Planctomycetota bacterium]|nr:MAG: hypothetical protein DRP62_02645 [Planctomycetota bacterium]